MKGFPEFFHFFIFGQRISLTSMILEQWAIMLVIVVLVLKFSRKLKTVPKGSQVLVELIVDSINKIVRSTMGEEYMNFAPYIGTLMIYLLFMNTFGIFGLEPPTSEYSVTLGLALVSFIVIQATTISRHGLKGYFIGYAKPLWPLAPINIIERLVVPVSLSLRLFGNVFAASILMKLVHQGLVFVSTAIHLGIAGEQLQAGIFQFIIPIPFNLYFDIFDGAIQMVIFSMLTMIFIKTTAEH